MSRLLLILSLATCALVQCEDILIIEQDYKIVEHGKGGAEAKDVRQIIYISPYFVCIDDLGGAAGAAPTESIMLDLKTRQIINLDHQNKVKVLESFDDRRKRIEKRKQTLESDRAAMPDGPQKEKFNKLWRSFLDDKRRYIVAKDPGEPAKLGGVECRPIKIVDAEKTDYAPLEAQLHPDLVLPYDNTEVLFLLQLIGKRMADFLHANKETFKYVPMQLHLDLAAGGTLDTKVVSVKKVKRENLDLKARGALGNPFEVPESYKEPPKKRPPQRTEDDKPN
ncbi:MAG TPA: hypothetical protein VEJ63_12060 [Planctomycetota bacterium]|nr:hypothetical protein [Planctomycetota bacterium]